MKVPRLRRIRVAGKVTLAQLALKGLLMQSLEQLKAEAVRRQVENLALARAYETTLSWLTPANFVLVVGAAILSLVAGASILIEASFLTKIQSGILALVSGAFTIVHSKLGCEQYQSECKKLLSLHRGIAADYENLLSLDDVDDFKKRILALNDQISAVLKSTTALPFAKALERARLSVR